MLVYANKKTIGGFVVVVFPMQGVGIIVAGVVSMIVSKLFGKAFLAQHFNKDQIGSTRHHTYYGWRIILMFGVVFALLTYYKMLEICLLYCSGRWQHQASHTDDMTKVMEVELQDESQKVKVLESYKLFSKEFLRRHGLHLLGTSSTHMVWDKSQTRKEGSEEAYEGLELTQTVQRKEEGLATHLTPGDEHGSCIGVIAPYNWVYSWVRVWTHVYGAEGDPLWSPRFWLVIVVSPHRVLSSSWPTVVHLIPNSPIL
eukprot:Gb_08970 [translate_table: standard]